MQTAFKVSVVFRLDAFPAQEIEDAMARESEMTPLQIQTEKGRCSEVLQAKGTMMQGIGKNLIRRSRDQQDSKPTT